MGVPGEPGLGGSLCCLGLLGSWALLLWVEAAWSWSVSTTRAMGSQASLSLPLGSLWPRGSCAASPEGIIFSGAVGSAAVPGGWKLLSPPLLCSWLCLFYMFQSKHLYAQMCGMLWHCGLLGRGHFVELWTFYWF